MQAGRGRIFSALTNGSFARELPFFNGFWTGERLPCVDVYGPRPIATVFGMFRIDDHNC